VKCRSSSTRPADSCGSHRRCPGPARHGSRPRGRHHRRHHRSRCHRDRRHDLPGRRVSHPGRAATAAHRCRHGRYGRLSRNQKQVNAAHAPQARPGERVNAELTNWRVLHKSAPAPAEETPRLGRRSYAWRGGARGDPDVELVLPAGPPEPVPRQPSWRSCSAVRGRLAVAHAGHRAPRDVVEVQHRTFPRAGLIPGRSGTCGVGPGARPCSGGVDLAVGMTS
jgi:hypothetical protein